MSIQPVPTIAHFAAFSILSLGYHELTSMDGPFDDWIRSQKGAHFQYLTVQALMAAIATFGLSVLSDLFPKNRAIARAKRLATMISLPTGSAVSSIYWTLIGLAPHLILPPAVDSPTDSNVPISLAWVPLYIDIMVHALPALFLVLDFYLLEPKYSERDEKVYGRIMIACFALWYGSWVEYLNTYNHRFPYPFLEVAFPFRVMAYIGAAFLGYNAFCKLNALHSTTPILSRIPIVQKLVASTATSAPAAEKQEKEKSRMSLKKTTAN